MENTAESMYKYFLSIIRKERTTTISPQKWNEWMDSTLLDWVKTKLPTNQFNQKRIDDLEILKVLTDGQQYDIIKVVTDKENLFKIPYNTSELPSYMHGLSVAFEWKSPADSSETDGDGDSPSPILTPEAFEPEPTPVFRKTYRVGGKVFRSDNRVVIMDNPFRLPDDTTFVYFENRGSHIYAITKGENYTGMVLEYYKYPEKINYDPEGEDSTAGSFQLSQNQEVVELAARKYLERITDPRYQSYTQEQMSTPS